MNQRHIDRLVKWGLVFSLLWLGGIGSLIAILLGLRAKRLIRRSNGELKENGNLRWCITAGAIGLALWVPVAAISIANNLR